MADVVSAGVRPAAVSALARLTLTAVFMPANPRADDLGRNVRPVPIAHPKLFPLRRTTLLSAVIAHCRPLEYDEEAAFNPVSYTHLRAHET